MGAVEPSGLKRGRLKKRSYDRVNFSDSWPLPPSLLESLGVVTLQRHRTALFMRDSGNHLKSGHPHQTLGINISERMNLRQRRPVD
jgi:hypothetical protein